MVDVTQSSAHRSDGLEREIERTLAGGERRFRFRFALIGFVSGLVLAVMTRWALTVFGDINTSLPHHAGFVFTQGLGFAGLAWWRAGYDWRALQSTRVSSSAPR